MKIDSEVIAACVREACAHETKATVGRYGKTGREARLIVFSLKYRGIVKDGVIRVKHRF